VGETGVTDLVIRSVNGRVSLHKECAPFTPHEKPLNPIQRRIPLSEREEPLDLPVLSKLYEFKLLDHQ
jgi:hypothetical protein